MDLLLKLGKYAGALAAGPSTYAGIALLLLIGQDVDFGALSEASLEDLLGLGASALAILLRDK